MCGGLKYRTCHEKHTSRNSAAARCLLGREGKEEETGACLLAGDPPHLHLQEEAGKGLWEQEAGSPL